MNDLLDNITLVFVSYKSKKKILNYINKVFQEFNIIVIENSADKSIIDEYKNKNCEIFFVNNIGFGSSINFARNKIKTDYFIVINPDIIGIDKTGIKKFFEIGKKLNNKFSCLGPRYTNIAKKTLKQSDETKEIDILKSISGAMMFFNAEKFDLVNGFDENFFLYFEETDYAYRANKLGLNCYQINTIKIIHEVGTSVDYKDNIEKQKILDLYAWHFIWSKFYFFRKHYGLLISYIYFLPILLRAIIKFFYFTITQNDKKKKKYNLRINGLVSSMKGLKSFKRI